MKNYQIALIGIISFWIGIRIIDGTIPSRYFAGELNEMGCAVIALTMGTFCFIGFDWKGFFKFLNNSLK